MRELKWSFHVSSLLIFSPNNLMINKLYDQIDTNLCPGIQSTVCPSSHPIAMTNRTCCDSQFKINNATLDPDCDGNYVSRDSKQICCPNSIGCPSKLCKTYKTKGKSIIAISLNTVHISHHSDGHWLSWEPWTNCTTRCSTRTRTRICTEP